MKITFFALFILLLFFSCNSDQKGCAEWESESLMDYYWTSIRNTNKLILKRTVVYQDGNEEVSYRKLSYPSSNTILYSGYDQNKNLIYETVESFNNEEVRYVSNRWKTNNVWVEDIYDEDLAFSAKNKNSQAFRHADFKVGNDKIKFFEEEVSTMEMGTMEFQGITTKCLVWNMNRHSVERVNDSTNYDVNIISKTYLIKGLGPVFSEVEYKENANWNHKVYNEFITIDEFNRL